MLLRVMRKQDKPIYKCRLCDRELEPRERPEGICDACLRASTYIPPVGGERAKEGVST